MKHQVFPPPGHDYHHHKLDTLNIRCITANKLIYLTLSPLYLTIFFIIFKPPILFDSFFVSRIFSCQQKKKYFSFIAFHHHHSSFSRLTQFLFIHLFYRQSININQKKNNIIHTPHKNYIPIFFLFFVCK